MDTQQIELSDAQVRAATGHPKSGEWALAQARISALMLEADRMVSP